MRSGAGPGSARAGKGSSPGTRRVPPLRQRRGAGLCAAGTAPRSPGGRAARSAALAARTAPSLLSFLIFFFSSPPLFRFPPPRRITPGLSLPLDGRGRKIPAPTQNAPQPAREMSAGGSRGRVPRRAELRRGREGRAAAPECRRPVRSAALPAGPGCRRGVGAQRPPRRGAGGGRAHGGLRRMRSWRAGSGGVGGSVKWRGFLNAFRARLRR